VLGVCSAVGLSSGSPQDRILVTVTGSNIVPQIEGETALPVQVITREDIERANIRTAAELLSTVSANLSFGSYFEAQGMAGSGQPGFSGASLRGLSYNRTLILLNGRRLVNYAFAANGVDLNAIPLAAIDRVEVLKDGASAIYGSDAIAGVINFILRKSYQGAEVYAQYGSPEHPGGYSSQYSATAGFGDLQSQKFSIVATVDYQRYGGIHARDRPFSRTNYIPGEGFDQTSGNSFPANVDTPAGVRNPTGNPSNGYRNPTCVSPFSFPTIGNPFRCGFDPPSVADIIDPSERLNAVGAFTWQFSPDHQFFLHAVYGRNTFTFSAAPPSVANLQLPSTSVFYPHEFAQFFGIDGKTLNIRWRPLELGLRTDKPVSEQWNVVAGLQGASKSWNYNGALTYGESNVTDRYVDGYAKASVLFPIFNTGVVNPFGFNTPDVLALISTAKVNGTVRTGKSTLSSADFHASTDIYELPSGPLALALGAEARQWKLAQVSSEAVSSGDILGGPGGLPSVTAKRNVWAVFAETNVPILKSFEANLALRHDHYSDFGSTTNPKLSFRWQPDSTFLMRASVGTGFKAPGLEAIYGPPQLGTTLGGLSDPLRCPVTGSSRDCSTSFPANFGGNPRLKADESKQWGIGGIWAPVREISLGADYFDIIIKNAITALTAVGGIFQQCVDGINGPTCQFIHRGPVDPNFPNLPGPITLVDFFLTNLGTLRTKGVDLNAQLLFPKLDWGRLRLNMQGTYTIKYLQRIVGQDYVDFVNREVGAGPGAVPYWRHYLSLDWDYGPWSTTITENFQQGTYDLAPTVNPPNGTQQRKIGDYDVWNVTGSYTGFKNWTFSTGIKNIFDRNPPLSIQIGTSGSAAQAGYDPTYTDPRGRLYWAGVKYVFK